MKKLIIAGALAISGIANAATLAWLPNTAGGHIGFTDTPCTEQGRVVYARKPGGRTYLGCWMPDMDAGMAIVKWSDGSVYTYSISEMNAVKSDGNTEDK